MNCMKHELFITQQQLDELRESCKPDFLSAMLDNVDIILTRNSNFFAATDFLLEDSSLSRIDRYEFLNVFMLCQGVVGFDGHAYGGYSNNLLTYLLNHKFISEEDYIRYRETEGLGEFLKDRLPDESKIWEQ